jgi:predicted nucleic acid-binding protein
MILIDTNVFSEMVKPLPDERVVAWLHDHRRETLLSTLVVAELRVGIGTTRGRRHRALLLAWLNRLLLNHRENRIVPLLLEHSLSWGEIASGMIITDKRSDFVDSLIGVQALALGVPVSTRNVSDFRLPGLEAINPWDT